ncbi:MAG TPA: NnrS family protein [Myxococcales bacterium]|nr:NnrS family protein [Myxococcales bacterium]
MSTSSLTRRDPSKLLVAMGAALATAGVLPWLLFALGLHSLYEPIFRSVGFRSSFHPLVQVEGFLACFAIAFLFAYIPRRTGTAPAARWQVAIAVAAPVAIAVLAFLDKWVWAQVVWLVLLAMAAEFSLRRMRRARLPASFVWVPIGILMGVCGAVLAGAGVMLGGRHYLLHEIGRGLLLQGMFTALVLGTFDLIVPAVAEEVDEVADRKLVLEAVLHSVCAVAFFASFFTSEMVSAQLGFAIRALVTLIVVSGPLQSAPMPLYPGMSDRMLRVCIWMLPLGYSWVAIAPLYRRAGLHVVYLGCFTALVLAVAAHLSLSRHPVTERQRARPWQLALGGGLLAVALTARTLLELDPPNFHLWLGMAAASFLTATVPWAALRRRKA